MEDLEVDQVEVHQVVDQVVVQEDLLLLHVRYHETDLRVEGPSPLGGDLKGQEVGSVRVRPSARRLLE